MANEKKIPTPYEFFTDAALYDEYLYTRVEEDLLDVATILFFNQTLDSYCVGCNSHATFRGLQGGVPAEYRKDKRREQLKALGSKVSLPEIPSDVYELKLQCTRNSNHIQVFYVMTNRSVSVESEKPVFKCSFQKIGQYPSIADLSIPDLKKYRVILGTVKHREFTKSVGLFAHNVGIGSFVYLRRVFEYLIEQAHVVAKDDKGWDDEQYSRSRMNEKVLLLRNHLPKFLIENPQMYSVLSIGIHELVEDDCLRHFPVLKSCIELILDEKIREKEVEEKIKAARKGLSDIVQEYTEN